MKGFMVKSFTYKTKIYYEDTDAGGIVYYANYLKYFERARTEWIYSLGFNHNKLSALDTLIVVRSCYIDYEKPVKFEEKIEVVSELSKLSPVRINLIQFVKDIKSIDEQFDLVVTDFEPVSAYFSRLKNIPAFGIGHQYSFYKKIPMTIKMRFTRILFT